MSSCNCIERNVVNVREWINEHLIPTEMVIFAELVPNLSYSPITMSKKKLVICTEVMTKYNNAQEEVVRRWSITYRA